MGYNYGIERKTLEMVATERMRSMNEKKSILLAINLIHNGYTWEETCRTVMFSKDYLKEKCKEHYKKPKGYEKLMKIEAANRKK